MRILFSALLAGALSGCASPEQIAYRQQQEAQQQEEQERAYVQRLTDRCTQFGFTVGQPDHRQCMLQLHQQVQANRGAAAAAVLQGYAAEQARQQNRPIVAPVQIPPTYNTNCTRDSFGNTNCVTR